MEHVLHQRHTHRRGQQGAQRKHAQHHALRFRLEAVLLIKNAQPNHGRDESQQHAGQEKRGGREGGVEERVQRVDQPDKNNQGQDQSQVRAPGAAPFAGGRLMVALTEPPSAERMHARLAANTARVFKHTRLLV